MNEQERKLELLEREVSYLRRQLRDYGVVSENPAFNLREFQKAFGFYSMRIWMLFALAFLLMWAVTTKAIPVPMTQIGSVPLVDTGGFLGIPGMGVGIIAIGGMAVGGIAFGGCAIGIIAIGGGACGVVAIGGGAIGVLAHGGGAAGLIAMGGGAAGYYALGNEAYGKYAFSRRRQDAEAVAFWTRWLPRFKRALTGPMPVIPIDTDSTGFC